MTAWACDSDRPMMSFLHPVAGDDIGAAAGGGSGIGASAASERRWRGTMIDY
jgi:hypothetical protein